MTVDYKEDYYYYDSFQMLRRFIITILLVFPMSEVYRLAIIRCLLAVFLVLHIEMKPFITVQKELKFDLNHLETLSIGILFVISLLADYPREGARVLLPCRGFCGGTLL